MSIVTCKDPFFFALKVVVFVLPSVMPFVCEIHDWFASMPPAGRQTNTGGIC